MKVVKCTPGQLAGLIKRDINRLDRNIREATFRSARAGVKTIRDRTPRAFGELQQSVQAYRTGSHGDVSISVDAPHAADVERGSRPHRPDMEALIRWVKLRGLQGLTNAGSPRTRFSKASGVTTKYQAMRIAKAIRAERVRAVSGKYQSHTSQQVKDAFFLQGKILQSGKGQISGRNTPVDAAKTVAMAIAKGIEEHGTKPHWYVRESLPELEADLAMRIKYAVDKDAGTPITDKLLK